ncbi:MAG: DUF4384 domain-containing protein [Betaproteobacteria bacterium]|nr:DUF4384 domain-containing protein [Betaproteobacteria bacterium]
MTHGLTRAKRDWFAACFIAAALGLTLPAFSQDNAANNRTALIIGIGEYGYSGVPSLSGVTYDMTSAQRIAAAMGIPEKNIKTLVNAQATKENILKTLKELGSNTQPGARAFVYFSGHGTRYPDPASGGCIEGLLTYEGQTITNKELASASQQLHQNADKLITLMDACHSGGVANTFTTRSSSLNVFKPKFFLKADASANMCSQPSNMRTRGFVNETTRLGALQENVVHITSSRPDEVSFDEPGKGGLATQGLRDCLLGQAQDTDGSGAVNLTEIEQCAQNFVDNKLKNVPGLAPHHITVKGNRNLIPVIAPPPVPVMAVAPAPASVPAPPPETVPSSSAVVAVIQPNATTTAVPAVQAVSPPSATPEVPTAATRPETEPARPAPAIVRPSLASLATLKDIEQQRNPKRKVEVKLTKPALKIGKDLLDLSIQSSHEGYVYLVLLGSDSKSFYLLYPNGLDQNNKILAGQSLRIPKPEWQIKSAGPVGTNHMLVMVSDSPRKLDSLVMAAPSASEPFTYALNNFEGRSALIRFLTSSGANGASESFGAKIIAVKEVP